MKLFTILDVYNTQVDEFAKEALNPPDTKYADLVFKQYIKDAYTDFNKHHRNGNPTEFYAEDHDELCMWCNFHSVIRDTPKDQKNLECMQFNDPNRPSCEDCLKHTIWYKRII